MGSPDEESFTISSKETLLLDDDDDHQPPSRPKHHRNKNLLKSILLALLILVILIAGSLILSFICKKRQSKQPNSYESNSSRFYCHVTKFPDLCYDSMSSIISSSALKSNPNSIFSTSLQVVTNQLKNISVSITKSLSSKTNPHALVRSRLSRCQAWVDDSLSRLNESLSVFGADLDVEPLTYVEMEKMKDRTSGATATAFKCLLALDEVIVLMVDGEEKKGLEEVKLGVQIARKYMLNSIQLLDWKGSILYDFYNPFVGV